MNHSRASSGRRRRSALQERLSQRIPDWYHPIAHFCLNIGAALALAGILVWYGSTVAFRPGAWVALPLGLVFANFIEWVFHRFPMHKRQRFLDRFFRHHTLMHHRYFDAVDTDVTSKKELYFVLTTAHANAVTTLVLAGVFFGMRGLFGADVAVIASLAFVGYAIALEALHAAFHLPERWQQFWPMRTRLIRALRRHHIAHHDPRHMNRYNFNIVVPFADVLLGTKMSRDMAMEYAAPPAVATAGTSTTTGDPPEATTA